MDSSSTGDFGHTYTKGRRQPYLIRKWPGSNWALPLGPYTITQLVVFVGSVYLLISYRDVWAHFGPFNLLIGVGLPLALTYATRHTRIEGRDPLRAGVALAGLALQPRAGYLGGEPYRASGRSRQRGGHIPVAQLPAELLPPELEPGTAGQPSAPDRPGPPRGGPWRTNPSARAAAAPRPWLTQLIDDAASRRSAGGERDDQRDEEGGR